jgi:adenylyltransferase/sulfurtransferase
MPGPPEISARDVQQRIDAGEKLLLIDVREPHEFAIAKIEGASLIPMRQVPGELQELEKRSDDAQLIVFCHHGVRSMNVVEWLRNQGVENCVSMAGGIDAWSLSVDPSVPRY